MNRHRHHLGMPLFSSRATATVSVALVLLLLGIAALTACAGHRVAQGLRDGLGFVLVLEDDATAQDIKTLERKIKTEPWNGGIQAVSPEEVLKRWQEMAGDEEDILALAGVNPFSPELHVKVTPTYTQADSLKAIAQRMEMSPCVAQVKVMDEMVRNIDNTIHSLIIGLGIVAVVLIIISVVLIFNTIRLSVYTRRFTIYTMRLVGATRGFIRKPFLINGLINGVVAGVIATLCLIAMVYYSRMANNDLNEVVSWEDAWLVIAGVMVAGVVLCLVATLAATNKYLSQKYDKLYK